MIKNGESTCSPSWLDAGSLPALLKSPPISFPYSFTEDDSDYEKDSGDNDEDFSEELWSLFHKLPRSASWEDRVIIILLHFQKVGYVLNAQLLREATKYLMDANLDQLTSSHWKRVRHATNRCKRWRRGQGTASSKPAELKMSPRTQFSGITFVPLGSPFNFTDTSAFFLTTPTFSLRNWILNDFTKD